MPNNASAFRLSLLLAAALLSACAGGPDNPPPQAAAQKPAAQPASNIRAAAPEELMGKTPKALHALMGPPSFLRRDHDAEVWQYAGQSCVLFAYLYPDGRGVPAVSYLDARSKNSGAVPVPDCLQALARDGAARPTS